MKQAHILYSGIVQGVGFRYTVKQYASRRGLCGWVKNLPQGSVEILVEGKKSDIDFLCEDVERHFVRNIRDKKISFKDTCSNFSSFNIEV